MPKVIEHLREDLLRCAGEILQTEGYKALLSAATDADRRFCDLIPILPKLCDY